MKRNLFFLIIFIVFFSISSASAETNQTLDKQSAEICINSSIELINEMNYSGFNVQRVNDILKQAQSLYESQLLIEAKRTLNYDFLIVLPQCDDIKRIRNLAFSSRESFDVLIRFYNSSIFPELDTTEVDLALKEINEEIESERYENVDRLISQSYEQINSLVADYSKLNALYLSTSNGIFRFVYLNRFLLIGILVICLIFFIFYYKKMKIHLLKQRIMRLELRKKTIKSLIMRSQKEYFEKGNLSEGNYNIRMNKFGELILDIDRQIPLLNEALSRMVNNKQTLIKREKNNNFISSKTHDSVGVIKKLPIVNKKIKTHHHLKKTNDWKKRNKR